MTSKLFASFAVCVALAAPACTQSTQAPAPSSPDAFFDAQRADVTNVLDEASGRLATFNTSLLIARDGDGRFWSFDTKGAVVWGPEAQFPAPELARYAALDEESSAGVASGERTGEARQAEKTTKTCDQNYCCTTVETQFSTFITCVPAPKPKLMAF